MSGYSKFKIFIYALIGVAILLTAIANFVNSEGKARYLNLWALWLFLFAIVQILLRLFDKLLEWLSMMP